MDNYPWAQNRLKLNRAISLLSLEGISNPSEDLIIARYKKLAGRVIEESLPKKAKVEASIETPSAPVDAPLGKKKGK